MPLRVGPKGPMVGVRCSGAMVPIGPSCYAVVIRSSTPNGSLKLACRKPTPIGSLALFQKPKRSCLKPDAPCFHFSKVSCLPKAIPLDQLGTITTRINNLNLGSHIMSKIFNSLCAAAALMFAATPAFAHVSLEKSESPRGKSYKAVLKVPHGCKGEPTHTVRVEIPEGFIGVKPMPKAGWTIKTTRGAYAQSYGFYHGPLSEGVKEIVWSGGNLPDDYYDEFVASGFIAREITADTLYFKVVQECTKGEERWVEIPDVGVDAHDLKAPAAVLKIADSGEAGEHDHGHNHGDDKASAEAGSVKIGTLEIADAFTRATAEGAKVGAGYLTIRNTGTAADTLLSVDTPVAARGEIHDMSMTDEGVMQMRRLADGIEIPAGGSVELKPGGKHLMLMDLKEPLKAGTTVTLKLIFKSGATGEVQLPVRPLGGGDGGHSHH